MTAPLKVLALEPWFGGSHRSFLEGLSRASRHEFRLITMAARFWKWRMQGGAVTLADRARPREDPVPDVIFASDMVNLPAFLAVTEGVYSGVPVVLYMHENQLTYPLPTGAPRDFTYGFINYLSCLAADQVVFNSAFHRDEFLDAVPRLLRRFPDYQHGDTVDNIRARSTVLPVGLDMDRLCAGHPDDGLRDGARPLVLVWNQRWEYDKDPAAFFRLVDRLGDASCPFRLIVLGRQYEEQPEVFERARDRHRDRVDHFGFEADSESYRRLLHQGDIVVSTSVHEFFGTAVMEAVACGCHPVLPNRLSYPELIPDSLHRASGFAPTIYRNEDELVSVVEDLLLRQAKPLPPASLKLITANLDWRVLAHRFDDLIFATGERSRDRAVSH